MTIALTSNKYRFDGRAALLHDLWAQFTNSADPEKLLIGVCKDNRISGLMAALPGKYQLFLCDGTIAAAASSQTLPGKFITLEPWEIDITSEVWSVAIVWLRFQMRNCLCFRSPEKAGLSRMPT